MAIETSFKENLMGALKVAVDHFNHGDDPNKAVMKAAEAYDFNSDQTSRLVETFNTARTIYHYKKAADRTSNFDLADIAVVIPGLFNKEIEQKKANAGLPDYTDYNTPEADYSEGMVLDKTAGVQELNVGEPTEFVDRDLNSLGHRAIEMINVCRDLADTTMHEACIYETKAAEALDKLARHLGRGYEEVCVDRYSRLCSGYADSKEFGPVLAKLAEFMPKHIAKQASVSSDDVIDDRDLEFAISFLKEAQECMITAAELEAVSLQLTKEASDFEKEYIAALELPQPEGEKISDFFRLAKVAAPAAGGGQSGESKDKDKDKAKPNAPAAPKGSLIGRTISEGITGGIKGPISDYVSSGVSDAITGPAERANADLSERLRNTQRQIILQDLITTDPILSEENTDNIARAYSSIMQIAPEVSTNKEIVRAILRTAVHSTAMSPYDAQSFADLEKSILQISGRLPVPGAAAGAAAGKGVK